MDSSRDLKPGAVTLIDVARAVGVHPSTVSRALDPDRRGMVRESTRRTILETASELGYRPHMGARSLQSGRTATVGIIAADLGNTFVTPIIHGVAAALEAASFLPLIAETQDDSERFSLIVDHMLSRRVDAMVVVASRDGDQTMLESAAKLVPIVVAGRPLEGSNLPHVIHDDRLGGEMVAEHLADLGHHRVAQLLGPVDVANFPRRTIGFRAVCERESLDEITTGLAAMGPTIDEGHRLMEAMLHAGDTPTAVFAQNDLMALGAMTVLARAGLKVPDDVSLVGYNDLPTVGHLHPALTTIRYPSRKVGLHAGQMALELLEGARPPDVNMAPELIVRDSTACPSGVQPAAVDAEIHPIDGGVLE